MKQEKYHGIVLSDQYYSFLYIDNSFTGWNVSSTYVEFVMEHGRFTIALPTTNTDQSVHRHINMYSNDSPSYNVRKYPVFMSEQ